VYWYTDHQLRACQVFCVSGVGLVIGIG
jgi:hypothetical protein